MSDVDLDAFKGWTPAAQDKALAVLQGVQNERWRPFYCSNPECDGKPHGPLREGEEPWTWNHARSEQRPPTDLEWLTWLIQSGRGSGKTRTGSEVTHQMTELTGRIALVGATGADVRDTMLEGESGIITVAKPGFRPKYEPSKRRLTWPNGCVGTTFSGEEPDRLRGPEHGFAWVDEPAHFPLIQDVWDNLMFGLRIGARPRVLCTTTPLARPWLKTLRKDPTTRVTNASTYANIENLAPTFAKAIISKYEGTRLGRQEIYGELLEDVEGALWTYDLIEPTRLSGPPILVRVVVGVDPAGSTRSASAETGIVVVGADHEGHLYVLADYSGRYTPHGWASRVAEAHDEWEADAVVAEKNFGADMVEHTLRSAGFNYRLLLAQARRGKELRAEPLVGLYEQGKVHHCGVFDDLETQMTEWVPYDKRSPSPDRVDALVYAAAVASIVRSPAVVASPVGLKRPDTGFILEPARG